MTQIDCKNRAGKFSMGRKVAGITFINDIEFLVATNDSSVRLYSSEDKEQKVKFKGHYNEHLQMVPSVDTARSLIAVGSEDGSVYVWTRPSLKMPKVMS